MHKNEPKLEVLLEMRNNATPNKEGVIVAPLTEKQLAALNIQIRRIENETQDK